MQRKTSLLPGRLTCDEPLESSLATQRLKDIQLGLCSVLLEASKFAVNDSVFEHDLKEATGVSDSKRIQALTTAYRENVTRIRAKLAELDSSAVPRLVDSVASVNCRLTSTEVEKLNGAGCVVKLMTSEGHDDVQFHCTIPQLEDLVWSLRQATKVVEKHAQ